MFLFFLLSIQSATIDNVHEQDRDIKQNNVVVNTTIKDLIKNNSSEILTNKELAIKSEKENNLTVNIPSGKLSIPVKNENNNLISKNETKQISKNTTELPKKSLETNITIEDPHIIQQNSTISKNSTQLESKPKSDVNSHQNKTNNHTKVQKQNSTKLNQKHEKKPVKHQEHNSTVPKNNNTELMQQKNATKNKNKINSTEQNKIIENNNTTNNHKQNNEIKLNITKSYEKISQINETQQNLTNSNSSRPIITEIPQNITTPKYIKYSKTQSDDEKPQKLNNPDPIERMKHFNETDENKEMKMIIPMKDEQINETISNSTNTNNIQPVISENLPNTTIPKYIKYSKTQSDDEKPLKLNNPDPIERMKHFNETDENKEMKMIIPMKDVEIQPNTTKTNNSRPTITQIPQNMTVPKYIKYSKTQSDDEKPQKLNNPDPIEKMKHFNETDENKEMKMIIPMKDVQNNETNKGTDAHPENITDNKSVKTLLKKKESEIEINVTFNDINDTEVNKTDIVDENATLEEPSQSEVLPDDDKIMEIEELDKKLDEDIKNKINIEENIKLSTKINKTNKNIDNEENIKVENRNSDQNHNVVDEKHKNNALISNNNQSNKEDETKSDIEEVKSDKIDVSKENKKEKPTPAKERVDPVVANIRKARSIHPTATQPPDDAEEAEPTPTEKIRHYRRPTIVQPPSLWEDLMSHSGTSVIIGICLFLGISVYAIYAFVIKPNKIQKHALPFLIRQKDGNNNNTSSFDIERGDIVRTEGRTF